MDVETIDQRRYRMDMSDPSPATLRIPPQSLEAEQHVLGAVLVDSTAWECVSDTLSTADFYRHEHRMIFEAMTALTVAHTPIDVLTVHEQLDRAERGADAGIEYLNALSQAVSSIKNVRRYAEIVRDRAMLRAAIASADEIASRAFRNEPIDDVIDAAKQAFVHLEQQRGTTSRRLPLLDLAHLRESAASVTWAVKNVLPSDSIGMLFGASGTFKSFVALDCALHIVHGLPWMGRKTKQGPVLYIAAEGGSGLWKRVAAWHRSRRIQWKDAPFYVVPCALDLATEAWRVVEAAQAVGITPSMVIVDTLSQTFSGEENSAAEMATYLRELGARFRQLWHCAVMLVHHTGHQATERPRGSSALRANLDFMFGVFRAEQEMLTTLTCSKQKEGDAFADATFTLSSHELGTDEDGDRITSLVARHLSSAEEIRDAMDGEKRAGRVSGNQLLLQLLQNGSRESDLRTAFYRDCDKETPEARRQAYHRAKSWATGAGLMEVAQGIVITLKTGP